MTTDLGPLAPPVTTTATVPAATTLQIDAVPVATTALARVMRARVALTTVLVHVQTATLGLRAVMTTGLVPVRRVRTARATRRGPVSTAIRQDRHAVTVMTARALGARSSTPNPAVRVPVARVVRAPALIVTRHVRRVAMTTFVRVRAPMAIRRAPHVVMTNFVLGPDATTPTAALAPPERVVTTAVRVHDVVTDRAARPRSTAASEVRRASAPPSKTRDFAIAIAPPNKVGARLLARVP
jgi:hypothetical protein